jgi:hypothetical protein
MSAAFFPDDAGLYCRFVGRGRMLVKLGTAAALCAAFMVAMAMPASAQNGVTRANGSYVPSRSARAPRPGPVSQQDTGTSTFDPPPNPLGQPMAETMSKPFNRTVGAPFGR